MYLIVRQHRQGEWTAKLVGSRWALESYAGAAASTERKALLRLQKKVCQWPVRPMREQAMSLICARLQPRSGRAAESEEARRRRRAEKHLGRIPEAWEVGEDWRWYRKPKDAAYWREQGRLVYTIAGPGAPGALDRGYGPGIDRALAAKKRGAPKGGWQRKAWDEGFGPLSGWYHQQKQRRSAAREVFLQGMERVKARKARS